MSSTERTVSLRRRVVRWGAGLLGAGLLARVLGVFEKLRRVPRLLRRYRTQLGEISASVTGVYRGLTTLPGGPPEDAIRVVWLSDVHNNPVAFSIARALVEQYDAEVVIDTGDIADWGTVYEAPTFAEIGEIDVPYVYIKGNHDGPGTIEALARHANVQILDDAQVVEVAGLRIVGDGDPRFTPDKSTGDDSYGKDRLVQVGIELAARIAPLEADIALIHDPVVARQVAGTVPLVLSGHSHKRNDRRVDGTFLLTQGSSGGAGLRGVRQDPPDPLTVSVLHFDAETKRLNTLDELTFGGLGLTQVCLVRRRADELGASRSAPEKTT